MNPGTLTAEALQQLRDALLEIAPEAADDDTLFFDTLDGETDVADQLRAVLRHALEAEAWEEGCRVYGKKIAERQKRLAARAERCRAFVSEAMQAIGIKSLPGPDFTATLAEGRPAVQVTDIDLLPEELTRVTVAPNLSAISKLLKAGEAVPGAMFGNTAPVLTVKRT